MKNLLNPFAICRAKGKDLGQSDEEVEKCILAMKRDLGIKNDEDMVSAFFQFAGHFIPAANTRISFSEDFFDGSNPSILEFMSAPFSVYGGKRFLAAKIAPIIPPHTRYVEPFAGAASIMFAKDKSNEEILIDVDEGKLESLNFLKTFTDAEHQALGAMDWNPSKPYFKELLVAKPEGRVERFHQFMYLTWNSFGKRRDSFAVAGNRPEKAYLAKKMHLFRERLKDVQLFLSDYRKAVTRFDSPETFFYADPPYIGTSNKRAQHFEEPSAQELADTFKGVKGKFLISNSDVPELREAFKDFNVREIVVPTRIDQMHGHSKKDRRELLIGNFEFESPQPKVVAASEACSFRTICDTCGQLHERK